MKPYVLISGDFVRTGGMDAANYWMARHLAERGHEVHVVAHRVAEDLSAHPKVWFHRVPKPLDSSFLGAPLLDRAGRRWAATITRRGGRVLANGGNCGVGGSNWVHYVHAAYQPAVAGLPAKRLKGALTRRAYLASERSSLAKARLIIANSRRTYADVVQHLPVAPDRVRMVYYGTDPEAFHPHSSEEKARARSLLGLPVELPVALFVGAAADERKGFSSLLEAWKRLCADPEWDVRLAVAGANPGLRASSGDTDAATVSRIHFLGFRTDIPTVLAACDLLVSPTRYEAYGLAVHEALCSGLPALVSARAGVAERYPASLQHLLLRDPEDAADLCGQLRHWRSHRDEYCVAMPEFSRDLRARTWDHACAEMVELIEAAG